MPQIQDQLDKIFLRTSYTVHYRRLKRVRWSVDARPDYSVLLMLGGNMTYAAGESRGVLGDRGGLLLDPGNVAGASGREAEFLTVTFSPSYVLECATRAQLVRSGAVVSFRPPLIDQSERLSRLARDLADELTQEEAGQELVLAALVDQMMVLLLRHHSTVRRADELELSRAGLVDRRIRRAVELMHAHLDRDLPLEEIAGAAYLSPFHFSRLFKKLTHVTPHAYLAGLRATRAQILLADKDLSITEISQRVGYSSPSHFTKAFRQAHGMTPRAFRAALVIDRDQV